MPIPSCFASPLLAAAPLLGAQLVVAGRAERQVERALVVAGVVVRMGHGRVRERVLRDEVPPPDLGRIHADLGREQVDRTLDRLRRLGPAGAAEGRDRRRVRHHRAALELDPRDRVDAARHQRRQVRQERAERRVRAGVLQRRRAGRRAPCRRASRRCVKSRRCARPCGSATMLSLRVSVQRTGLPSWRASQTTSSSSTSSVFAPKPPPTSGAMTRTCRGSRPSVPASRIRSWCGVCVESQAVSRPSAPDLGGGRARLERARRHALADERARDDDVAAVEQLLVVVGRAGTGRDVRAGLREEQHLVLSRRPAG